MPNRSRKNATGAGRRAVTRREVLDIAAALFSQRGYRATSLGLVAKELGVSRQALYYHFMSKDEILAALYEELMTKLEVAVMDVLAEGEGGDVPFERLIGAHTEVTLANADLMALLVYERPELARLKWLRPAARRRDYAGLFIPAYEAGARRGELLAMDPWAAVNTVLSAINGVVLFHHGESGRTTPDAVREQLHALLATGIFTKKRRGRVAAALASAA